MKRTPCRKHTLSKQHLPVSTAGHECCKFLRTIFSQSAMQSDYNNVTATAMSIFSSPMAGNSSNHVVLSKIEVAKPRSRYSIAQLL